MLERLVARLPALLVLLPIGLVTWVALVQRGDLGLLPSALPAAVLLLAYVRAGRASSGGGRP